MVKIVNSRIAVMPPPEVRKNQGELYQTPEQKSAEPEKTKEKDENGGRILNHSTFEAATPIGKNLYIKAIWGVKQAKHNDPVRIIAQLNAPLTEQVTVNIIHKINERNEKVVVSMKVDMKNGHVDTTWQARNPADNRSEGHYYFIIFGGKANAQSKPLFLS
jgi:hypothetical protein